MCPQHPSGTLGSVSHVRYHVALHRISRNESIDPNFPNLPIPTPELLKLFVEFYIKLTELIVDYKLCIKPREWFLVNRKDIAYLLRHLFVDNYYDYIYKRVIVYRVADSAFKGLTTVTEVLTEIARRLEENRDLDTLYTKYISRNNFSKRDLTPLFDIYKKYLLERSYLSENLLNKATLDSELSR
ncbi:uncharacterized protein N7500_001993 [Penicillium coprophilum]|uniref:uncharacterized protein n=1 Tax=Penicillium coprophilum TaxID=36646 RepID=UPI002398E61D|nr:uncharacterized protein N7500_001993 [Penicillium coprophilum]KAJ5174062.1 hypothetical protein N7500_001993 [Penicillium coprophilum]